MKCRNCVNLECDWCDMKADSPDPDMERECHWFAQKTNADRIRAMTDEELAELFMQEYDGADSFTCPVPHPCPPEKEASCRECFLDWLREEAKE